MLKEITISNYALIDYLRIDLSKGFTSITGETGAGKSIILGGLSLALGKRAEPNLVKDKTKKCFVDLLFSLKSLELKNLFNSLNLDYDTLTTIRREIIPSGKSRAFVNDTPVNLEILQKLSFELIDIHSQFQNHFIIKEEYQMDILDLLAKNQNLIEKYTLNFSYFKEVKNKINKLESSRFNMNQEKDYNTYLLNEINSIDFSDSLDSMEKALKKISNSEEINSTFNQISNILQNEENGISIKLNEVRVSLKKITNISNEYKRIFERIESVIIELDDIVRDVRNENDIMEFNPEMREILSEKLEKIYSLFRKHQVDKLDDLILIKGRLEKKVSETENIDAIINEEKKKLVELEKVEGEAQHYCKDENNCKTQIIGKIQHFVSRKAMNIESLGSERVALLFNNGLINNIADIYKIEVEKLTNLEGMAEKSALNLIESIKESKKQPFQKVLFSMGIRHVGETVASKLANHFCSIENLINSSYDDLVSVEEIGEKIVKSINHYFKNPQNLLIIEKLSKEGINFKIDSNKNKSNILNGKTFVISGTFEILSREEIKQLVLENGGKLSSAVNSKTKIIIGGESIGPTKKQKAYLLKIPIIGVKEFLKMLNM